MNIINQLWTGLLDLLYPDNDECICCHNRAGKINKWGICDRCDERMPVAEGVVCSICGRKSRSGSNLCSDCRNDGRNFTMHRSPYEYMPPVISLIRNLKYHEQTQLAEYLGRNMADTILEMGWEIDIIVPVPLHLKRLKQRGYNQAELLADVIGEMIDREVDTTLISRNVNTPSQVGRTRQGRADNLINAFAACDINLIIDKRILVVDDVYTTGSTINECSGVLKSIGAAEIYAVTTATTRLKIF